MCGFDLSCISAIQRLFNFEDQHKESMGCVQDSVTACLILKHFNVDSQLHLGEICADGIQDSLHCWLSIGDKIMDIGIYGNSNYNPYYSGKKLDAPIILENTNIKYLDGTTEQNEWINILSEKSLTSYILECPRDWIFKMFCYSLNIHETDKNKELLLSLANNLYFPKVITIPHSPSYYLH